MISRSLNSSPKTPPLTIIVIALFAALMLIITAAANWMLNLSSHKASAVKAQAAALQASAFEMETSGTTAGLRGIHAVGGGVAWASGERGTVLRTEDSGYVWQTCAMPPGAEKLDFRAVWGWDANNAVVMSSGPGDQSRLYKTTDGCSHWKLLYTNPDPTGFWDAMLFTDQQHGTILGDPVSGAFVLIHTEDGGQHWQRYGHLLRSEDGEGAFAASNSSITQIPATKERLATSEDGWEFFGTGGKNRPRIFRLTDEPHLIGTPEKSEFDSRWKVENAPLASGTESSGVFSLAFRDEQHGMAAGGDYQKSNTATGTAAWTEDGGKTWTAAAKPPHGYRSAVAWDEADKLWITVGTNGADVSRDDGRTWTSIDNGNWNAISLPWIVGPTGRIAKLVSWNLKAALPKTGH